MFTITKYVDYSSDLLTVLGQLPQKKIAPNPNPNPNANPNLLSSVFIMRGTHLLTVETTTIYFFLNIIH